MTRKLIRRTVEEFVEDDLEHSEKPEEQLSECDETENGEACEDDDEHQAGRRRPRSSRRPQ